MIDGSMRENHIRYLGLDPSHDDRCPNNSWSMGELMGATTSGDFSSDDGSTSQSGSVITTKTIIFAVAQIASSLI